MRIWRDRFKFVVGAVLATLVALTAIGMYADAKERSRATAPTRTLPFEIPVEDPDPSTPTPPPSAGEFTGVDRGCIAALVDLAANGVRMITKVEDPPAPCASYEWPHLLMAFSEAVEAGCLQAVVDGSFRDPADRSCEGLRQTHVEALIRAFASPAPSSTPSPADMSS